MLDKKNNMTIMNYQENPRFERNVNSHGFTVCKSTLQLQLFGKNLTESEHSQAVLHLHLQEMVDNTDHDDNNNTNTTTTNNNNNLCFSLIISHCAK